RLAHAHVAEDALGPGLGLEAEDLQRLGGVPLLHELVTDRVDHALVHGHEGIDRPGFQLAELLRRRANAAAQHYAIEGIGDSVVHRILRDRPPALHRQRNVDLLADDDALLEHRVHVLRSNDAVVLAAQREMTLETDAMIAPTVGDLAVEGERDLDLLRHPVHRQRATHEVAVVRLHDLAADEGDRRVLLDVEEVLAPEIFVAALETGVDALRLDHDHD